MKLVATAPGKLVVLGEFAVLHGAPAIVLAVERRAEVVLETVPGPVSLMAAPALGLPPRRWRLREGRVEHLDPLVPRDAARLAVLVAAVEAAAGQGAGAAPGAVHLSTDTRALATADGVKLGLGASAAVSVATCAVWRAACGLRADVGEVMRAAVGAHRRAQGGGSGVDVAASALGGLVAYRLGPDAAPDARRLSWPRGVSLLAVWSGVARGTPAVLAAVEALRRREPRTHAAIMSRLAATAAAGLDAVTRDVGDAFLAAARAYARDLGELGNAAGVELLTPLQARAGEVVEDAGGVYKPSGAGGDLGLALGLGSGSAERIAAALARAGLTIVPVQMATTGLQVSCME